MYPERHHLTKLCGVNVALTFEEQVLSFSSLLVCQFLLA
jgi:hypothetical protein